MDCTIWGKILTKAALLNDVKGTVVYGVVRDTSSIKEAGYSLFSCGAYMRSGKNRVYKAQEQCPLSIQGITIQPGDIIVGDDDGVLAIPYLLLNEILAKVKNVNTTEKAIVAALKEGMSLKDARKIYHYEKPWADKKDK